MHIVAGGRSRSVDPILARRPAPWRCSIPFVCNSFRNPSRVASTLMSPWLDTHTDGPPGILVSSDAAASSPSRWAPLAEPLPSFASSSPLPQLSEGFSGGEEAAATRQTVRHLSPRASRQSSAPPGYSRRAPAYQSPRGRFRRWRRTPGSRCGTRAMVATLRQRRRGHFRGHQRLSASSVGSSSGYVE